MDTDVSALLARIEYLDLKMQDAVKRAQQETSARQDADTARQDAESARQDAESARQDAEKRAQQEFSARQDAEKRAQQETSARQDAEKRARTSNRHSRLLALKFSDTVNIPQIARDASKSLSSSTIAQELSSLVTNAPWTDCLESFDALSEEDKICNHVLNMLNGFVVSPNNPKEREDWHPIVSKVLNSISQISNELQIPVLKPFYESKAEDGVDNKEPDFAFTLSNEQRRLHANTCLILEVKGTQRSNASRPALLREGVAQAIGYLAQRQESCLDLNTCGIAIVTSGALALVVVCIDFKDDAMPITISSELDFIPPGKFVKSAQGSSSVSEVIPDGLRALVRLLCTVDVTSFGLALQLFIPGSSYQLDQVLGVGGFATVVQLTLKTTETAMACKWLRHADVSVLQHERNVLNELAKKSIPFVPRVCSLEGENGIISNDDGSRHGLLMMPVGIPCKEALIACSDNVFFAVQVLEHIWKTLQAAHSARYTHSDVRPSNVIKTETEERPVIILIDWGLSQRLGATYRKQDIHGVPAFMSNRRLDLLFSNTTGDWKTDANDDLEAAVLTFFALAVTWDGQAPWQGLAFSGRDLAPTRTKWIADNAEILRGAASQINDPSAKTAVINHINSAAVASPDC